MISLMIERSLNFHSNRSIDFFVVVVVDISFKTKKFYL